MTAATSSRRGFIAGLMATGLIPKPSWADAGSPAYLAAAARSDGTDVLCGISANLDVLFQIPLPDRGHAAAAHPSRPEAVAFARRPGTFAIVIDCSTGVSKARLTAPTGRHFYGHGAFSEDGHWLFTTENDYEAGQGRIGVWDVAAGYARAAEFASGGLGPHDIKRLPESDILVVANGGIDTHPDTGRTKLNIPTMRPNLSYIADGVVTEIAEITQTPNKNSIRHLAISATGQVAFGMQWQGNSPAPHLVGVHTRGTLIRIAQAPQDQLRAMQDYIGSIAYSADGATIAVTSPRGGLIQLYDVATLTLAEEIALADVCGVAEAEVDNAFTVTTGQGQVQRWLHKKHTAKSQPNLMWDNHLIKI